MKYTTFIKETICKMDSKAFNACKDMLIKEKYISFKIIANKKITPEILAEKLCDYFHTLNVKDDKTFNSYLNTYMNQIDDMTCAYIAKASEKQKGDAASGHNTRARRYYEKASLIKKEKEPSFTQLKDFSRIMMCLYMAGITAKDKPISDFNILTKALNPKKIIDAMKAEEVTEMFPPAKKKRYNITNPYSAGSCMMVFSIVMLWSLKSQRV